MRLSPPFFKVPSRNSIATPPKHAPRKPEPPRIKKKTRTSKPGRAPASAPGRPGDVDRSAGGETRKISPNLTVTVISTSMREHVRRQPPPRHPPRDREGAAEGAAPRPPCSARSLPARTTTPREEGARGSSREDDHEEDRPDEDKASDASNGYTYVSFVRPNGGTAITPREEGKRGSSHEDDHEGESLYEGKSSDASSDYTYVMSLFVRPHCDTATTATTGTLATWDEDSRTTLSDLTEQRSWRRAGAPPGEDWRRRLACGLPTCGACDVEDDAASDESYSIVGADSYSIVGEDSCSIAGEESAGCFVLG